jgi:hypothetical protein
VLEIFELRPKMSTGRQRRGSMIQCKSIAPKYGVTAKTVREIWRGQTWTETTWPLWTEEEINARMGGGDEGDADDTEENAESQS